MKFRTPEGSAIEVADAQSRLGPYLLKAFDGKTVRDARWLVLLGEGYSTEVEARKDGKRAKEALLYASAASGVGIDCGDDKPTGYTSKMVKLELEKKDKKKVYDDVHGLAIYPKGEAYFLSVSATVRVGRSLNRFQSAFEAYLHQCGPLSERQMAALALLNGVHFELPPTNRLLLAMTTIEILCERAKRNQTFLRLVKSTISLIDGLEGGGEKSRLKELLAKERANQSGPHASRRLKQ